jgi:cell shape-determining protein MreC
MEKSTDRFVAVDYQLLDQATRAAETQARSTEALAQEVETLKQELESIKKQLGSQNHGQDSPKQKAAPLLKQ